jgi:hypothetical protein
MIHLLDPFYLCKKKKCLLVNPFFPGEISCFLLNPFPSKFSLPRIPIPPSGYGSTKKTSSPKFHGLNTYNFSRINKFSGPCFLTHSPQSSRRPSCHPPVAHSCRRSAARAPTQGARRPPTRGRRSTRPRRIRLVGMGRNCRWFYVCYVCIYIYICIYIYMLSGPSRAYLL